MIKSHLLHIKSGVQLKISSNLSYFLLDDLDRYTEYRVKIIREHLEILLEDLVPVSVQPLGGNDTTMMMVPDEEQTEPIREPMDMELDKAEGDNLEKSLGE